MKWYSAHRRVVVVVAVAVIGAGAAVATYSVSHTQQQNAGTADGIAISQADVDANATIIARVRTHSSDVNPTNSVVEAAREAIDYKEAVRRGLDCTIAQAHALLQSMDATAVAVDPDSVFFAIEDSGRAPLGYHLTPVAQRTPDTAAVIQQYEQDPNILAGLRRFCAVSHMVGTVVAERPTSEPQGADAEATFRAGIYAHSTVIAADGSALDVREPTATPTP